jgi:hypothetical protein
MPWALPQRWIFCRFRSAPADPKFFVWPAGFVGGVYHVSTLYVILGMATEIYSHRINLADMPVDGLVRRRYWSSHFVAFTTVLCSCSFHLSLLSLTANYGPVNNDAQVFVVVDFLDDVAFYFYHGFFSHVTFFMVCFFCCMHYGRF